MLSMLHVNILVQIPWTEGDYPPCVDCPSDPVVTFILTLVAVCLFTFLGYLAGVDSRDR